MLPYYLDDFLNVASPGSLSPTEALRAADDDLDAELRTCEALGVPVKASKLVRPTMFLTFLGIELDSIAMIARLPQEKVTELRSLLTEWVQKRSGSKRRVLSLAGKLQFASQVIPPAAHSRGLS